MSAKVVIIGRGELTPRQKELLKKWLGEYTIVQQIEQLNSVQQIPENADVAVSFVMHPTVISVLQNARKFNRIQAYGTFATEALFTKTATNEQELQQLQQKCQQNGGDIMNTKVVNGQYSLRCTKTAKLLVNPVIQIVTEQEID